MRSSLIAAGVAAALGVGAAHTQAAPSDLDALSIADEARLEPAQASSWRAFVAGGAHDAATALRGRQRQARRFAALLTEHFALNPDIYDLAQADTVICRCEDVPLGALAGYTDARSAKLATRCGMGACQGRICGAVLAELQRFPQPPAATPLFPARLSTLEAFRCATLPCGTA